MLVARVWVNFRVRIRFGEGIGIRICASTRIIVEVGVRKRLGSELQLHVARFVVNFRVKIINGVESRIMGLCQV